MAGTYRGFRRQDLKLCALSRQLRGHYSVLLSLSPYPGSDWLSQSSNKYSPLRAMARCF